MKTKDNIVYRELDLVPIPEDVPDLGVKAGDTGVVDFVYDGGHGLHVEIPREDGTSIGFVQLEAGSRAVGEYVWQVVSYSHVES